MGWISLSLAQGSPVAWDPRGLSPGCQGYLLCSDFHIWSPCCASCGTFKRCLAEPSGVIVHDLGTCVCVCWSGSVGDMRWKSLTRWWLWWAQLWGAFWSSVGEIQLVKGECLVCLPVDICLPLDIFDCPLLGILSRHQCKDTEWLVWVKSVRLLLMNLVFWTRFSL